MQTQQRGSRAVLPWGTVQNKAFGKSNDILYAPQEIEKIIDIKKKVDKIGEVQLASTMSSTFSSSYRYELTYQNLQSKIRHKVF